MSIHGAMDRGAGGSTAGTILVVGELCPDIVVTGVPTSGTSLRFGQAEDLVGATTMTLGSSAGITACAAAASGADVALLAVVGDDELGQTCRGWLSRRGVRTELVRVDEARPTGSSIVLVRADDNTDRQILTHLGAMESLRSDEVTDAVLAAVRHVHVSSFFLHVSARESLHERLARARQLGLSTSLDTNDDPDRVWASGAREAVAQSDVLFVNDAEAVGLAGLGPGGSPDAAVEILLASMPTGTDPRLPAVVHKRGAEGAAVRFGGGAVHIHAPEVAVVDTVGAGDTLAGTVLAALVSGADWTVALSLGVAAASLSTQGAGGVAAQAGRKDVGDLAATLSATASSSVATTRSADERPPHEPAFEPYKAWEGTP
jgi:sugar/nucleoside kinase (ribokinase family)